jgi:hypothetical protein
MKNFSGGSHGATFVLLAALCLLPFYPASGEPVPTNSAGDAAAFIKEKGKILVFSPRTRNLKEFETLARAARDAGFTHVVISELSERTDLQGADKDSPWCEWSTILPAIFKHATPPGLEDAYPADFVKRQMTFMKAKHDIAAKLGLRCAYYGVEPNWLNDKVYRSHPRWRGSRADNSLRTTGMFFAPNTDNPEVRELYRQAVKEICRQCPLLDIFSFVTNDSGAFYPWEKRMYVNPNGPTGYEDRDMGERVVGFLSALRQGALDAGVDGYFYTSTYFTPDERHALLKSLKKGIGVQGWAPEPYTEDGSLSWAGGWGGGEWLPSPVINCLPTPMDVVGGVANIKTSKVRRFIAGGNSLDYFTAFKAAMAMPPASTVRHRMDVLQRMAEAIYAPDVTDEVLNAWDVLERANVMMNVADISFLKGPVMLRWLTRPLVPHQELLTKEERAYWEPYLYQSRASQPDTYLDYVNVSGNPEVKTWEEATWKCVAIDSIASALADAAGGLQVAADKTTNTTARAKLRLDAARLKAQRCMVLTIRHYLQMGTLIRQRELDNAADPKLTSATPLSPNMPKGDTGSEGLFFMHRAMRWELDNTYDLISLLENSPEPLIFYEEEKANEGALFLGPDILKNLRKKVDIMLKYWRTAEDGYYRPTLGG